MRAPFLASERVPRRRGRSPRSHVHDPRLDSISAASPRGLLFSTHARRSGVGRTIRAMMKAGGSRRGENKMSAGGQKPRTTQRSGVETRPPMTINAQAHPETSAHNLRGAHSKLPHKPSTPLTRCFFTGPTQRLAPKLPLELSPASLLTDPRLGERLMRCPQSNTNSQTSVHC